MLHRATKASEAICHIPRGVPLGIDSDALSRSSLMRGRKCSTSSRTSTFSSSSLPSPPSSPTWNMKPLPSGQEDLSHRIVHINPRTPSTPHAAHSLLTPRLSHLPKEPVKPASWMAEQLTPISTPRPSVPPDSRDGLSYEMCPRTPSYGHLQSSASHTQSSNHTREYRIASVSNDFLPVINDFQTRSFTPQHYHTPQQNLTYPLHGPSPISASDPGPISYAPRTAADREALASFGQIF
ncbi:uncharacterized protein EI90DRAFT_1005476 [Cantharellus anzutake]|uniref:uncharacterized protein n=1 Tax=Cantharellus anzutake TaxID=1750568 RepID=UPI0019081A44|nr:uncharacterized protein EI90DRAFT_1005476 [Cantharellus anzutake]KAF8331305.1 hypothetical protein EI90DRAFT_1005476 [Cantharellus anzutake]